MSEEKMRGVYSVLLQIPKDLTLKIGKLGSLSFLGGFYVYTGSAMGPGGISKRVSRHLKAKKKMFWHIDYVTDNPRIKVIAVFRAESKQKLECKVNKSIVLSLSASIISGFGSTDCQESCGGHLLFLKDAAFQVCLRGIGEAYLESGLNPVSILV
jgi:Uri superfamily endonuclease|tara:strand:- start:554 stop:1018 length:465 start_codon:yes stop_codon:yes gene_type:complete